MRKCFEVTVDLIYLAYGWSGRKAYPRFSMLFYFEVWQALKEFLIPLNLTVTSKENFMMVKNFR